LKRLQGLNNPPQKPMNSNTTALSIPGELTYQEYELTKDKLKQGNSEFQEEILKLQQALSKKTQLDAEKQAN
jgi:hypothetical protein